MYLLSVPMRLRFAAMTLLLGIPIAVLEVIVAARVPWWRLPVRQMHLWMALMGFVALPLFAWVIAGKKWVLKAIATVAILWCLLSAWFALRTGNISVLFFTVFLSAYWGASYSWIRFEMSKSFFDPGLH